MSEFSIPPQDVIDQYTEVINGRKRVFTVSRTHVHVRVTLGFRLLHDVRVPLEWLTPDYATMGRSHLNYTWAGASLALIVLPLTIAFYANAKPPQPEFFVAIALAASGVVLALLTLLAALVPRTWYRFPNSQGIIVLDVAAIGPDRKRCEQFVNEIRQLILASAPKPPETL